MSKIISQKLNIRHYKKIYASLTPDIFTYLKSSVPENEEEEKKYIKKLLLQMQRGEGYYYVYMDKGSRELKGFGGLKIKEKTAEIQLWVKQDQWGKGIGKFIIDDLVKKCIKICKIPVIACNKKNSRALKLFKKIGFVRIKNMEQIISFFKNYDYRLHYFVWPRDSKGACRREQPSLVDL